jgi:hypothetical protein
MKRCSVLLACLLASPFAAAQSSCAVQAATLMSQQRLGELAGMFAAPSETLAQSLAQWAGSAGAINEVVPASGQSAGRTVRRSVTLSDLPDRYAFDGSWAVLVTQAGERVVLQASAQPSSRCKLLALHVDVAAP